MSCNDSVYKIPFQRALFAPASAVEGIKAVMSVCVSALPAEQFDIRTQNLVEGLTMTISLMSPTI